MVTFRGLTPLCSTIVKTRAARRRTSAARCRTPSATPSRTSMSPTSRAAAYRKKENANPALRRSPPLSARKTLRTRTTRIGCLTRPASTRWSFAWPKRTGQTYHGLSRIDLSNFYADPTCMKNFISFDMFREAGVPSPLASYVWLTVNGEELGLYLVLEHMGPDFLGRTMGGEGWLYKPESDRLGFDERSIMEELLQQKRQPFDYGEGAELSYRGDALADYPEIFGTKPESKRSQEDLSHDALVIRALKGLSEGEDPARYLDTDELLRYFAVHNFLMNYDSYTGPMLHNYYLYENGGRLAMFPWDYNDLCGTFWALVIQGEPGDATGLANLGIDTPLLGVTPEQHADACCVLKDFFLVRAESIRRQLDGMLSASTAEKRPEDRVDSSHLSIEALR